MAQLNDKYAEKRFAITEAVWTALSIPIDCNRIKVRNANAPGGLVVRITSDDADAAAYDLIDPGDTKTIEPSDPGGSNVVNFRAGATLAKIKSDSAGASVVFVTYLP